MSFKEILKIKKSTEFYKIFNEEITDHFFSASGHSMFGLSKLVWVKDLKGFLRIHKRFA